MGDSPIGSVWNIPRYVVHRPRKPRKIRVVFDCSPQIAGKSLNPELLTGPDLTYPIVGVLTRGRQRKVALMADVEFMYYQVRVLNMRKHCSSS